MNRPSSLLALVVASVLVLGPGLGRSGSTRLSAEVPDHQALRVQRLESRACKPQAPLVTQFDVTQVPGAAGLLSVRLEVQPRIGLAAAVWELELPEGLKALGPRSGAVDPRAQVTTRRDLLLEVTSSGREGLDGAASLAPNELALVVRGTMRGGPGAAVLTRRSVVQLNAADGPAQELRHFANTATGARTRVAVLSVLHRGGR